MQSSTIAQDHYEQARPGMDMFIDVLRALAAILITNTHYVPVYPHRLMASGGLLGDVIFFAVSGYCIYGIRGSFASWYSRRLSRIYPAVWVTSVIFILCGFYSTGSPGELFRLFVWPTQYHFVSSILLLYAAYYAYFSLRPHWLSVLRTMLILGGAFLVYYLLAYDTSIYRIDGVRSGEIRVLFGEAMLLGAYLRESKSRWMHVPHSWLMLATVCLSLVYAASKLVLTQNPTLGPWQLANWVSLLLALFAIFISAMSFESEFRRLPRWAISAIIFMSSLTLEIYVVQYELIPRLAAMISFPANFLLVSCAIGASAFLVHQAVHSIGAVVARTRAAA